MQGICVAQRFLLHVTKSDNKHQNGTQKSVHMALITCIPRAGILLLQLCDVLMELYYVQQFGTKGDPMQQVIVTSLTVLGPIVSPYH